MVRLSVNGISLYAEVQGDGEPILLLHGFADSLRMWDGIKPALLKAGYKVITYDQRGFGQSDAPPEVAAYELAKIVEDAKVVINEFCRTQKVRLVGHDWGALVGWMVSIQYPELVHSFVAVSLGHPRAYRKAGLEQRKKGWYILAFQLRGIAEFMLKANNFGWLRRLSNNQAELERWTGDLSRPGRLTAALNWYRANMVALMRAHFADCTVPVMGVYSTGDPALVEAQMINSKNYVKNTWQYERIDNCGHWIPTERPELFANLLLDWINASESSA
ncbi:MAG TPA: alpha/beta fold hydrolase [Candidatus Obscuribacterales bacterium]